MGHAAAEDYMPVQVSHVMFMEATRLKTKEIHQDCYETGTPQLPRSLWLQSGGYLLYVLESLWLRSGRHMLYLRASDCEWRSLPWCCKCLGCRAGIGWLVSFPAHPAHAKSMCYLCVTYEKILPWMIAWNHSWKPAIAKFSPFAILASLWLWSGRCLLYLRASDCEAVAICASAW